MTDEKKGDCFAAALSHLYQLAKNDPTGQQFVLIHGNVAHLPQEQVVNHAWVEEGEVVHEVANGQDQRIPKAAYYSTLKVTTTRRYSWMQAVLRAADDSGPWDN